MTLFGLSFIALCDAHPSCRYFLHGTNATDGATPALRECVLFEAQAKKLDDCDGYIGEYSKLAAVVNGRTFVDTVSWFGEPETTFATIPGISYQDCASVCK